jgi:hypothetical protein
VNYFEIESRQDIECLLTDGFGQFSPSEPGIKQWSLIATRASHGHLLTRGQGPCPEVAVRKLASQARGRMFLQPTSEFEERAQVDGGLEATGHLGTAIGVNRPRRNGLPDLGTTEFQILHVSAAKLTHDNEVMLMKERMKRVTNPH